MKFKWCFFLLSTLLFGAIRAQRSIDLLTISTQYSPKASYINHTGDASERAYLLNLKVPVVFNEGNTIWYTDVTYNYFNIQSNASFPVNVASPLKLHGLIVQTGIAQKISEKNTLQLLLAPRLMGDYKIIDKRSFQPGIVALFERDFNPNLLMRFGAMYNSDLFGPMVVPLVYVDWKIKGGPWFISGLIPIYSKIGYQFNNNLSAGIGHFGLVTSYTLNDAYLNMDYIERRSIDVTAFTRYRLSGNLHLEGRIGYALSRDYGQYNSNDKLDFKLTVISFGDNRNRVNYRFEDNFIANLRLVYNYPLD